MAEVGSAYVSLLPSARGFGSKMQSQIGPEVDGVGKSMGSRFGNLFKVGALAAVGGAVLATKFLKGAVDEAREAQVVTARTENVIKKMGNAAGISAKQVGDLAGAISLKTGIDDEAIQSGQNLLLTFGNIRNEAGKGNDIFNQTSKLMVDMSAAMGTDAKGSAIQLGKALNDPVKGLTALSRVGVSFTEGQKKTIEALVKTGDTMGAQKVILAELEKQFGGAAAAMATPADKAKVAYANLKEQIGTALLPVIDKLLRAFTGAMPAVSRAVEGVGPAFTRLVGFIRPLVGEVLTGLVSFVKTSLIPAMRNLYTALQPALTEAFGLLKTGLSLTLDALRLLGPALVATTAFIATHKTAITALVITVGTAVLAWKVWRLGIAAWTAITKAAVAVQAAYNAVMLANPIGLVIVALVALAAGIIYAYKHSATFRGIVDKVWAALKVAGAWIADTAKKAAAFASVLAGVVVSGVRAVIGQVGNIIGKLADFGGAIRDRVQDVARFVSGLKDKFGEAVNFVQGIPGKIKAALGAAATLLYSAGQDIIRGLINGIKNMAGAAADAARAAVKGALDGAKSLLGIRSPSTKFAEVGRDSMLGYKKGVDENADKVRDAMVAALKKSLDAMTEHRDKVRAVVDQIKSNMASLSGAVSSAFTGNLFEATTGADFVSNLTVVKGSLKKLSAAFKKLVKWGLPAGFLSQLFSSGNGALILDLASGSKSTAFDAFQTFGQVQNLSQSLGGSVARNQYGDELRRQTRHLEQINRNVKRLARELAQELNRTAAQAQRSAT